MCLSISAVFIHLCTGSSSIQQTLVICINCQLWRWANELEKAGWIGCCCHHHSFTCDGVRMMDCSGNPNHMECYRVLARWQKGSSFRILSLVFWFTTSWLTFVHESTFDLSIHLCEFFIAFLCLHTSPQFHQPLVHSPLSSLLHSGCVHLSWMCLITRFHKLFFNSSSPTAFESTAVGFHRPFWFNHFKQEVDSKEAEIAEWNGCVIVAALPNGTILNSSVYLSTKLEM